MQRSYSAQSQMAIDDLAVVSDEAARLQRTSEQAEVQLRLAERFGEPVKSVRSAVMPCRC